MLVFTRYSASERWERVMNGTLRGKHVFQCFRLGNSHIFKSSEMPKTTFRFQGFQGFEGFRV